MISKVFASENPLGPGSTPQPAGNPHVYLLVGLPMAGVVGGFGVLVYYHWPVALAAVLVLLALLFFTLRFVRQVVRW
jgi:hypothetical protein